MVRVIYYHHGHDIWAYTLHLYRDEHRLELLWSGISLAIMNELEKENNMRHIPLWRRLLYKLTGGCLVQHQWNISGTTTSGHLIHLCEQCGKKVVHFAKVE